MMKAETDPITDDEWLLRRVHVTKFHSTKTPMLTLGTFEPRVKGNEPDIDGISLYRHACLVHFEDVLATIPHDKRVQSGVVRVSVSFIRSLGLTVKSMPVSGVLGHIVIPELNSEDYAADKARFGFIKEQLAIAASEEANILRRPTTPTE